MENNAPSLTLKGLFNITTIVLWTQSPNASPSAVPCDHRNVTGACAHSSSTSSAASTSTVLNGTRTAVITSPQGVEQLLGDHHHHRIVKPDVHDVINHGTTSYPRVADNDLLNYEISHVPLLNIVAASTTHSPTTATVPQQITTIIHAAATTVAATITSESSGGNVTGTAGPPAAAAGGGGGDDDATSYTPKELNNYWALLALILVIGTAAGNILVCLAITWERRLQNVTNYFLMSLAITDLMVAILVMPLGILTLFHGKCAVNTTHLQSLQIAKRLSIPLLLLLHPTSYLASMSYSLSVLLLRAGYRVGDLFSTHVPYPPRPFHATQRQQFTGKFTWEGSRDRNGRRSSGSAPLGRQKAAHSRDIDNNLHILNETQILSNTSNPNGKQRPHI